MLTPLLRLLVVPVFEYLVKRTLFECGSSCDIQISDTSDIFLVITFFRKWGDLLCNVKGVKFELHARTLRT